MSREAADADIRAQYERAMKDDAERYRWFRELSLERKVCIAEMAGDEGHMLDHFIDKGMCGL